MIHLKVQISRFNPQGDLKPHTKQYAVDVNEGARILNVLQAIQSQDPTLSFRSSCRAGQCGSCAVRVNGEPKLACMAEATDRMLIEPLDLPVIKDLVVELVPGINSIPRIHPCDCHDIPDPAQIARLKPLRDCIECLSCVSACPAMKVTDFIGPTSMRAQMRIALDPRETESRIRDAIAQGLFTCTSCQRCRVVCPKEIEIPGKAIEKLREIANREGLTLPRHQAVADLVKRTGRSVETSDKTFLDQVPDIIEPFGEVKGEVGFFVGCMFNGRLPERALDLLEVMKRVGIRVIIPKDQICCGSPLIRTGQTSFLDEIKEKNIRAFTSRGITTVMTMCAGCGSTLKHDYETPFTVKDVTEILTEIKIPLPARLGEIVTYHDPCHLMNGQGISEQPRELIRRVAGSFVEMPAQCCGSGGGVRSGLPEEAAALGELRRSAIEATGADSVITICPFCEYHIQEHTDKPVKNLMTLLLEGYRKKEAQ
ncbi:fumarate reductase (CoM/CoB) subunit TfrB [Methanospirillum lacunae]|uniref:Succinate dehydrogenase/fumarate reductase iron-sulfur subunit n=1 Tax=Methanospirillum lacunae TaxID=668570 RepID=A0A2V2N0R9_9EURY|nr:fumarate reductase (CoM/CoB) subunit TfrB [Methanospirillum lacunae]PWR70118.1 succinate dehydrogenase/fumarate reductase iron-sulfur subunit [Methanospirillum lacunae]